MQVFSCPGIGMSPEFRLMHDIWVFSHLSRRACCWLEETTDGAMEKVDKGGYGGTEKTRRRQSCMSTEGATPSRLGGILLVDRDWCHEHEVGCR